MHNEVKKGELKCTRKPRSQRHGEPAKPLAEQKFPPPPIYLLRTMFSVYFIRRRLWLK